MKNQFNTLKQEKKLVIGWVVFLLVAHFPMQYLFDSGNPLFGFETIHELFDLDAERAFTAWTSQALLLLSGVSILLYKAMPLVPRILSGGLLVLFCNRRVNLSPRALLGLLF